MFSKQFGGFTAFVAIWASSAAAQVAPTAGTATGTAAPATFNQLPAGSYYQPSPGTFYQLPVSNAPQTNAPPLGSPGTLNSMQQPMGNYGAGAGRGTYPAPQVFGGAAPDPSAAGLPATQSAGSVTGPGGMQTMRFGTSAPAPTNLPPPPRSVLAGPEGSRKLQSLSGEHLYLDGGLKVKLAGVLFPPGAEGNPVRSAIREIVRTNYFFVEREQGSPPLGDSECRAWVTLPDGRNLAMELLRTGLVRLSRTASFRTTEERDALFAAEEYAHRQSAGLWAK